jgi:hypothetical protein
MSDVTFTSLIGDIRAHAYNPPGIQAVIFNAFEAITNAQVDLVDASNPFVYSLSATAASVAAFVQENESRTRRLYPSTAQSASDLYYHMSDLDYVNRFAVPTSCTVTLLMQKAPLIDSMIYEPSTGHSVLVLPRNTEFSVNSTSLSMQYPLEIRQLTHGGLQITYLNDKPSPLKALPSNLVNWSEFSDYNSVDWVKMEIDVDQFYINTSYQDISTSAGLSTTVPIIDQFYYARCYLQDANTKQWNEILTTHSDQIYDPSAVTAVIQVLDTSVKVTIPVVYATTVQAAGKLRVDIYETQGAITRQLERYTPDQWSVKWQAVDENDLNDYTTAVANVNNVLYYSTSVLDGGRDALSFTDLKSRVIDNSVGAQILPITQTQLASSMKDLGYDITKHIDTLTDRVFLATREIPKAESAAILTPVNAAMLTASLSMIQAGSWLGAYSNTDSVTLTDASLYQYINGVTTPVSAAQYAALMAQPLAQRCHTISQSGYYYSPFTYVLDSSTEVFESRAYYLQAPDVIGRDFVDVNENIGLQATMSQAYSLVRVSSGYELYIQVSSSDDYKALPDNQVGALLSMISPNQATRVYVKGVLHQIDATTNERVWKFTFTTNYYIDALDQMEFPSIVSTGNGLTVKLGLTQSCDLLLLSMADAPIGYASIDADLQIVDDLYAGQSPKVISQEHLSLKFGSALKTLWNQTRSAVAAVDYQTYSANVPARYSEDVYQKDTATGASFSVVNGQVVYTRLYKKGDPILDEEGQPVYQHRVGDLVLDSNGQPQPVPGYKRYMVRYVDLAVFGGVYYFATDSNTKGYLKAMLTQMLEWLTVDIPQYQSFLLEQTRIYFHPKATAGTVKILDHDGQERYIQSEQALNIKLYVSPQVYADTALRKALVTTTVQQLQGLLAQRIVSVSQMTSALRDVYNKDVVDVELSGLGGDANRRVLTVLDDQSSLSLGKRLVALGDNTLLVEEDLDIQFIQHGYMTK